MGYSNLKSRLYDFLYYLSLTLYLIGRFCEYTIWAEEYGNVFSGLKDCAYLILLVCVIVTFFEIMLSQRSRLRTRMLPLIILEAAFLIYALRIDVRAGFVCMSYSICSIKIDKKKMYRYIMFLLVFLLATGIVGGMENIRTVNRMIGNTRTRLSFAFVHPYTMQVLWMSVVSCGIIINEKFRISYMINMSLVAIMLHLVGGTRSAFICTELLLVFGYFYRHDRRKHGRRIHMRGSAFALRHIFTILFVINNGLCLSMAFKDSPWLQRVDYLFTGRLSITVRYFKGICKEMVPLFPVSKDVNLREWALGSYVLDSAYSQLLFGYGLIYSIMILCLLHRIMERAMELHLWSVVMVFVAIAFNSMMEPTILSILYNPGILLCIPILIANNKYPLALKAKTVEG
nr:hypothetical protein [uncultured Acetatifactor sp.]